MKRIQILFGVILIILGGLIPAFSQESTPKTNSVANSVSTAPVSNGESVTRITPATDEVCDQRLVKTLDALEKAEKLIAALDAEIAARKRLDAVNDQIIDAKNAVIVEQAKLVEMYKKQAGRKISLLFGLVKIRY